MSRDSKSGLFTRSSRGRTTTRRASPAKRLAFGLSPKIEDLEARRLLATLTWTGTLAAGNGAMNMFDSGTNNVSTNWDTNTFPVSGDTLVFPDAAQYKGPIVNDTAADTPYVLHFTGSGFTINGNEIVLATSASLKDMSTTTPLNTLATPLQLEANPTITVSTTGHTLSLTGAISQSGGTFGLAKNGTGTLSFDGSAVNTYAGNTAILNGILQVDRTVAGAAIPGASPLVIGSGSNGVSTAQLVVPSTATTTQFGSGLVATIHTDGHLEIDSASSETLASLTEDGQASVNLGNASKTSGLSLGTLSSSATTSQISSSGGVLSLNGKVSALTGATTISADVELNNAARSIVVSTGASLTISGVISDGTVTPSGFALTGGGTLTLTGANTFTGTANDSASTLALAQAGGFPSLLGPLVVGGASGLVTATGGQLSSGQPLTVNTGGTFRLLGAATEDATPISVTGTLDTGTDPTASIGATGLMLNGGAKVIGSGTLSLLGDLTVTGGTAAISSLVQLNDPARLFSIATGATLNASGVISDGSTSPSGILQSGGGKLVLSGANTYTGTTEVLTGTLSLANPTGTSILGPLVVGDPTTTTSALATSSGGQIAVGEPLTVNSGATFRLKNGSESLGATTVTAGTITINGTSLALTPGSLLTVNGGTIGGTGALLLAENVTSDGTYGPSTISAASVVLASPSTTFTVLPGAATSTGDLIISSPISDGTPPFSSLIKAGTGRLVLTGASTYSDVTRPDGTSVTGGVLEVDGSITSNVLLDGGTLAGTGTVGNVTFATPTIIDPGTTPGSNGTLTVNNLHLDSTDTYHVDINAGGNDEIIVKGTVILDPPVLDIALNFDPALGQVFTLIDNLGTDPIDGTFLVKTTNTSNVSVDVPFKQIDANRYLLNPSADPTILRGTQFILNYAGGTGNDLTLMVVAPPVAVDDSYALPENAGQPGNSPSSPPVFTVPAFAGVLANDVDTNHLGLQAQLVSPPYQPPGSNPAAPPATDLPFVGPKHGTLVLNGDGSFTYIPAANYVGEDSFVYFASDGVYSATDPSSPAGAASAYGVVHLFVNATSENPVASDDFVTTLQNTALTSINVLGNDFSPDGLALTAELVAGATHGTATLNGDGKTFTYTPDPAFHGTDTFTYRAVDSNGYASPITTVSIDVLQVDQKPVANNDFYSTNEESTLFVDAPGVLANDTDPDNTPADPTAQTLRAVLLQGPTHGMLTLFNDGSFSYTPDPLFNSSAANGGVKDSFMYEVSDGLLFSDPATVTITVNAVDHAPIARDDAYASAEGATLTVPVTDGKGVAVGVLANDTDPDNTSTNTAPQTLTAVILSQPLHGTLALAANGSFVYTPTDTSFSGTDSFTYRAFDGTLYSDPATVNLFISSVNHAPVAVADAFITNEDVPLVVAAPGVLGNDSDPDNTPADPTAQTLSAILIQGPEHGTIALAADGSFTYTPDPNYNNDGKNTDFFTYQVSDGQLLSGVVRVDLTVNPVADAPTAVPSSYTGIEDTNLVVPAPGILLGSTNVDGGTPTIVLDNGPQHGAFLGGAINANGSFTYIPNPNYNGTDSFTYHLLNPTSGLTSDPVTVTLTLLATPDAPVGVPDPIGPAGSAYTTLENVPLVVNDGGVLANDINVDGDALHAQLVTGPAHGSVVLNSDGTFTYTPAPYYNGPDSFTYVPVNTSLAGMPTLVNLSVVAVPTTPTAVGDSYSTLEDTALTPAAPGVLVNDTFPDGAPTITVDNLPQHGTLTGGIINANGTFTYTPAANYHGPDSFTYHLTNASGETSASVTVSLTVISVPDAPVGVPDPIGPAGSAYTTLENVPLVVNDGGVLANDINVDGDALHAQLVTGPAHGSVVLNSDGTFTYTPAPYYNGPDSFTYVPVNTSLAGMPTLVNLSVVAVPTTPTAVGDSYSTLEDTALTPAAPGVLVNDTFPDGAPTITVDNLPQHGTLTGGIVNANGTFTYTPAANYFGPDSFTYHLTNAAGQTSPSVTVSLTVIAVADAPVAMDDSFQTLEDTPLAVNDSGVLANDTNVDKDTLHAKLAKGPLHGSVVLNSDGTFTYTPSLNYNGSDSFTYYAVNTSLSSATPATVTIDVVAVPDAPTAANDSYSLLEDTTLTVPAPGILLNDTNVDGGLPTISIDNGTLHGGLNVGTDGKVTYVPMPNYFGTDSFTYHLTNAASGLTSGTATVTLTILPVPDAPVAINDAYQTNEDVPLVVNDSGVLANDINVDKDTLHAQLINGPVHGSVVLNTDGTFTYTPDPNYNGTDTFTYLAVNTSLPSASTATVTITVLPVNDAPVANPDTYNTEENQTLTIPAPGVLGNDSDVEGPDITAVLVNTTQHGTLSLKADGSFVYVPNPEFTGVDTFTYRAFDGQLYSPVTTVTINVAMIPVTTVMLDPASDTGVSNTDRITNDTTPTFYGTTRPDLTVKLYAQPLGSSSAPMLVGTTTADAFGNYRVTSSALPDGQYAFSVNVFRPDGLQTGVAISGGDLLIDTVAPRVQGVQLDPKTGQVYVVYIDQGGAGMGQASITDVANYAFDKLYTHAPRAFAVSSVTGLNNNIGSPTAPQTVVVNVFKGKGLKHGRYLFGIVSGGVTDVAGNPLDGEFVNGFPSGDGVPGGNFQSEFLNNGHDIVNATNSGQFVPIFSASAGKAPNIGYTIGKTPTAVPSGPVTAASAKKGPTAKAARVVKQASVSPSVHKLSVAHRARKGR